MRWSLCWLPFSATTGTASLFGRQSCIGERSTNRTISLCIPHAIVCDTFTIIKTSKIFAIRDGLCDIRRPLISLRVYEGVAFAHTRVNNDHGRYLRVISNEEESGGKHGMKKVGNLPPGNFLTPHSLPQEVTPTSVFLLDSV